MLISPRDRPGFMLRLCGPEGLKESSSGHYSATGSLSDHSSHCLHSDQQHQAPSSPYKWMFI